MFGFIADLIASAICIALPSYLAAKALRIGDPAQTAPWLLYFVILGLFLLFESWTLFIIGWIPFYSWFRLFFLLYLVLPQTQGAKVLYLNYVEPFITHHEKQIDEFIGRTHYQLEQLGLGYVNIVIEWLREKVLGQASPQQHAARVTPPQGAQGYATYASDLLSRFAMPAARTQAAPAVTGSAGSVFNMLSSAAGAALAGGAGAGAGTSRSMPASVQAASVPDTLIAGLGNMSSDQKTTFINTQRDRLTTMLKALDKEQHSIDLAYGDSRPSASKRPPSSHGGEFTKSRSQMSFDNIDYDDVQSYGGSGQPSQHSTPPTMRRPSGSSSWNPGNLGGWIGGSPREESHRDRDDYDRRDQRAGGADNDSYANKAWSTARDITDTFARNARDTARDRYER